MERRYFDKGGDQVLIVIPEDAPFPLPSHDLIFRVNGKKVLTRVMHVIHDYDENHVDIFLGVMQYLVEK